MSTKTDNRFKASRPKNVGREILPILSHPSPLPQLGSTKFFVTLCSYFFLDHCVNKRKSLRDLISTPEGIDLQSDVPLSGESPEIDVIARDAISADPNHLMSVAASLYQQANKKLVG